MELAQSMLFNSADPALVLVANKSVLLKVNVTSSQPGQVKPTGQLRVETAAGVLVQQIPLVAPVGAFPSALPSVPTLNAAYTAVVPANLVTAGMRLTATLSAGQVTTLTVNPRVGGGVPITVVALPLQIGSTVAGPVTNFEAGLKSRFPVSNVTQQTRSPYVSQSVTTMPATPTDGPAALLKLLTEINALPLLENAGPRTYYLGVLPDSFLTTNSGVANLQGNAAIVQRTLKSFVHELGHNLSLMHAPCGTTVVVDPNYPYANALMGSSTRAVWGFNMDTQVLVNPLTNYDVMSYCGEDNFSDYNHGLIQAYLTPGDRVQRKVTATSGEGPQELLLVSGSINGNNVTLAPLKSLVGEPTVPQAGEHVLRIVTARGTVEHRFASQEVPHLTASRTFAFTVPNPGSVLSLSIDKQGDVLLAKQADSSARGKALQSAHWTEVNPVLASQEAGMLRLKWNHQSYPFLSLTYVGQSRIVLAQDLQGGAANLKLPNLPAGGRLEYSLSDGLNTMRWTESR